MLEFLYSKVQGLSALWRLCYLLDSSNDQQGFQHDDARAEEVQTQGAVAVVLQKGHQKAKPYKNHDGYLQWYRCST